MKIRQHAAVAVAAVVAAQQSLNLVDDHSNPGRRLKNEGVALETIEFEILSFETGKSFLEEGGGWGRIEWARNAIWGPPGFCFGTATPTICHYPPFFLIDLFSLSPSFTTALNRMWTRSTSHSAGSGSSPRATTLLGSATISHVKRDRGS
jgi:hypothetical protein